MYRFTTTLTAFAIVTAMCFAAFAQQVTVSIQNETSHPAKIFLTANGQRIHWMNVEANRTIPMVAQVGQAISVESTHSSGGAMGGTVTHANQVYRLRANTRSQPQAYPQYPQHTQNYPQQPQTYPQQPQTYPQYAQIGQGQPQANVSIPETNQKVLEFARSRAGQYVRFYPNGTYSTPQCTELAEAALRHAGARGGNNYTWGSEVSLQEAMPGDIVQLQNAHFGNKWSNGPHTAIVTGVSGTTIHVLEQNIAGSAVQAGTYELRNMQSGTIKYYRPQPHRNVGSYRGGFPQVQPVNYDQPYDFPQQQGNLGAALGNLIYHLIDGN